MTANDVRIDRGTERLGLGRDLGPQGWSERAVRSSRLSVLVCPGCGKAYDVRVRTIDAELFCDRCRLTTEVVIRPGMYEPKEGKEKGRE